MIVTSSARERDGERPDGRVDGLRCAATSSASAPPSVTSFQATGARRTGRRNEGAGGEGRGRSAREAHAVEHQLRAVGELQREPVPAGDSRGKPPGPPLVVEPGRARERFGFRPFRSSVPETARRGDRDVVGVLVRSRPLLRDAALARGGPEASPASSVSARSPSRRAQPRASATPPRFARRPVLVEDVEALFRGARDPGQREVRLLLEARTSARAMSDQAKCARCTSRSRKNVSWNPYGRPSAPARCPVQYHHSRAASGCEPWSRGKTRGDPPGSSPPRQPGRPQARPARGQEPRIILPAAPPPDRRPRRRRPGARPARTDAASTSAAAPRASPQGTASDTVQPNDCGLMTSSRSQAKRGAGRQAPRPCRSTRTAAPRRASPGGSARPTRRSRAADRRSAAARRPRPSRALAMPRTATATAIASSARVTAKVRSKIAKTSRRSSRFVATERA